MGDYVYTTVSFDTKYKHNNKKEVVDDVMHRFKFKNGQMVGWRGTEDTARANAAYNSK